MPQCGHLNGRPRSLSKFRPACPSPRVPVTFRRGGCKGISLELITTGLSQTLVLLTGVFVAGVVRGCIGFGFSALVVVSTSLFLNPSEVVPLVVLLEIVASVQMALRVWRDVLKELLVVLLIGACVGTPLGVYILSVSHADTLRLLLSGTILAMSVILSAGYVYSGPVNRQILLVVGAVSGAFNGIAGIGGMPVAIFLASVKYPIRRIRASMIFFLLGTELIFVATAAVGELYQRSIINTFVMALLPMAAGLVLGSHLFSKLDERLLRRIFLWTLLLLAVVGVSRAVL